MELMRTQVIVNRISTIYFRFRFSVYIFNSMRVCFSVKAISGLAENRFPSTFKEFVADVFPTTNSLQGKASQEAFKSQYRKFISKWRP